MSTEDVPSRINFHDPSQALAWEESTIHNRPWRPKFFATFAAALNGRFSGPLSILELGSGPGHLAEAILSNCNVRKYVALDFSEAMHNLAAKRIERFQNRIDFVRRDFRLADWPEGLGHFDALLTMQAAHETRHVRHLHDLLCAARNCLKPDGVLLYCDHYLKPETGNPDLYLAREGQRPALERAGFAGVTLLLDEGGMALYSCNN